MSLHSAYAFVLTSSLFCSQTRNNQTKPTTCVPDTESTVAQYLQSFISLAKEPWTWLCKRVHMVSHPGSGLQKGVGVHVSPCVTWASVAISHLLHPLAPSQELPSLTATCHHLYPRSVKLIVAYSSTNERLLFPQKSVETYRKAWRISCYGDHR